MEQVLFVQHETRASAPERDGISPRYARYALAVLVASSTLNALDRQIVSIIAQDIKIDLALSDAQLGFLLGTAFAVFYAVAGITMGRIADTVSRTSLMAGGLAVWSGMTALGAGAYSFATLALARIGVGVGEATASPCAYSLICQYFPAERRSVALACYLAGLSLGGAAAMIFGGMLLQDWYRVCRVVPIAATCALPAWKGVLLAVGLPGIPLAILVARLREPPRPPLPSTRLASLVWYEASAALPPFTLFSLHVAAGRRALISNLLFVAALAVATMLLMRLSGDVAQWAAIALGGYVVVTWGQIQKHRDPRFHALTYGCPTYVLAMLSAVTLTIIMASVNAWAAPYAIRVLGVAPIRAGVTLGLIVTVVSSIGMIGGGWLADRWKSRDPRAPVWIALCGLLASGPATAAMVATADPNVYFGAFAVFGLLTSGWAGAFAALVQDLVLPRMRGAASSAFNLVSVVFSMGLGPYLTGKVSSLTGSLGIGLLSLQLVAPICLVFLLMTARRLMRQTPSARTDQATDDAVCAVGPGTG